MALFLALQVAAHPLFILYCLWNCNRVKYLYISTPDHITESSEYPYKNITIHKPTRQTSTMHDGRAEHDVDGSRNPRFARGSCIHTRKEDYPTWVIYLGYISQIFMVNVTNREGVFGNSLRSSKSLHSININSLDHERCNFERVNFENRLQIKW